jgi:tetratricopeptide (TPR) repeat protein
MGVRFIDEPLLATLLATLQDVFPHVRVYAPRLGGMVFLASARPLDVEASAATALAADPETFGRLGLHRPEDVAVALVMDEEGVRDFARDAPVNTDAWNRLETGSPHVLRSGAQADEITLVRGRRDPLERVSSQLDPVYLVRALLLRGQSERALHLAETLEDPAARASALGLIALARGNRPTAARRLEEALALDPDAVEARVGLLRVREAEIAAGGDAVALVGGPLDDLEAAVAAAWRSRRDGDWDGVRALDSRLAAAQPTHPAYVAAAQLRADWRLAAGDPAHAGEAIAILDELLSMLGRLSIVVRRAQAAALSGDSLSAFRLVDEISYMAARAQNGQVFARAALRTLDRIPTDVGSPEDRQAMRDRLLSTVQRRGARS